jgi:ketosteroid isomerase-like protein
VNLLGNLSAAKRAIELFHSGRVELMRTMLDEDIIWRVPHSHPLAEDIVGVDNVLAFFQRVQKETDGTFGAEVIDIAGNERRIFCLMHVHAKRAGKTLDQDVINIWMLHPQTGKVVDRQFFMDDLAASDEFWAN